MKTYTHPKWYIAKYKLTNYLWDLYEIDNWTRKFHHLVTQQELLDFWFIEDNQEDWIENLIDDINIWNKNSDYGFKMHNKYRQYLRQAILKHYPLK